jgi:Ca-activated chloride channel homolog
MNHVPIPRRLFLLRSYFAIAGSVAVFLSGCTLGSKVASPPSGFEVKMVVGSALESFCNQAANQLNQQQPKLNNGKAYYLTCEAQGSGDVVTTLVSLANQLKKGTVSAEAPQFPVLVSVDGEIYQSQLIYQMNQLFPGQRYIPDITDSPLLANSPMVFMTSADLAPGLQSIDSLYKKLVTAQTHRDLNARSQALKIHFVQTAPTRSNSGLQTLVAQFAEVSGTPPERLTVADVQRLQPQVQQIQSKVTRYGVSTHSLAQAMVKNGPFWASMGSVYESSVIEANSNLQPNQTRYQAVYPKVTFLSNMRAIVPTAPWVSADEKAAAEQVIEFLRSPQIQKIATDLGLRPGVSGIALGPKFTADFGVDAQARYTSLRPPKPDVVAAMVRSWETYAKKPSLVVLVVDSSGSMEGTKMPAVQRTLQTYINALGPKEQIALIDFDSDIRPPVRADGTPQGKERGLDFVNNLRVGGGTRLYDAAIYARDWLLKNARANAINAVLVLTDGEDSGSRIGLDQLGAELSKSGFASDQRIGFFTVGYGKEGEFNPTALQKIAELNGGYYSKGDPETIARVMSNLQVEF